MQQLTAQIHSARQTDPDNRLRSLFDASPAVVFVVDAENRYVYVNRAWEKTFSRSRAQIVGSSIFDLFPEDVAGAMAEESRRVLAADGPLETETSVNVDGELHTFVLTKMTLPEADGYADAVCGIAVDITERKRGEGRLRLLSDIASNLVARGEDIDRLMAAMCARLTNEMHGDVCFHYRPEGDQPRLHLMSYQGIEPDAAVNLEWLDYGAAVCGTVAVTQRPWIIPDVAQLDDTRTHLLRSLGIAAYVCCPLLSKGVLYGTLSLGRRAGRFDPQEVALVQITADLAAMALERAAWERRLMEADVRRQEYLAVVAHELRAPLGPIGLAAELLRYGDPRFVDEARTIIERQTQNLSRLVEELLDDARMSHGKVVLETRPIAISDIVSDGIELSRREVDARGHALTLALPVHPAYVLGDRRRLAQVVSNLLVNSAKYTPEGGHIKVTVTAEADTVTLRISDDGIGIEAELLPRIFDLFQQARNNQSTGAGLGIGLSLVKSLVELHGGVIEVHSAGAGQGSEFVVHLPRHNPAGSTGP